MQVGIKGEKKFIVTKDQLACNVGSGLETELTEIAPNGKMLTFKVAAYDEAGLIGEGTHQRAIVAKERFEQKAQSKLSK